MLCRRHRRFGRACLGTRDDLLEQPAGSFSGGPFDALELVHLEGGVFNVLSFGGQQFAWQ